MELRRLPADEAAVCRFTEELWLPSHRDLEAAVDAHVLADDVDEPPSVFDRPTRLIVGDVYVRGSHRGSDLATDLMERAAERAREVGCDELVLDVDADNDRAIAFYEKLGFAPYRYQLTVPAEEL